LSCMLSTYLLAMVMPVQLRDEFNTINVEIRGRSFLVGIIFGGTYVPIVLMIFAPLFIVGIVIILLALIITYLLRDKMIFKVINIMTEAGYV
ncbi:MAG: hypothetical protein QXO96_08665, partial [Sulfolobales archaeon]